MKTNRSTQILAFSVPPAIAKEVESFAKRERRTKSELFREMVRVYGRYRILRERDEHRWVADLISEAQAEQTTKPIGVEEILAEDSRLARYGAQQAKKHGIRPKDIDRILHERRKAR